MPSGASAPQAEQVKCPELGPFSFSHAPGSIKSASKSAVSSSVKGISSAIVSSMMPAMDAEPRGCPPHHGSESYSGTLRRTIFGYRRQARGLPLCRYSYRFHPVHRNAWGTFALTIVIIANSSFSCRQNVNQFESKRCAESMETGSSRPDGETRLPTTVRPADFHSKVDKPDRPQVPIACDQTSPPHPKRNR